MNAKFDELVRALDPAALEELRRSVAAEVSERRAQTGMHIEKIHAGMSESEKAEAMREIARVLRGEDNHA